MDNGFLTKIKKHKLAFWGSIIGIFTIPIIAITLISNTSRTRNDASINDTQSQNNTNNESYASQTSNDSSSNVNANNNQKLNTDPTYSAESETNIFDPESNSARENTVWDDVKIPIEGLEVSNSSFIYKFIDDQAANYVARDALKEAVLGYINDNAHGYAAFVAGKDIHYSISFPYDSLAFILQVSNHTEYYVQLLTQKHVYFGMVIYPIPYNGEKAKFYINFIQSPENRHYDANTVIEKLTQSIQLENPNVILSSPTINASYKI